MPHADGSTLLVADIGGTNTRVAIAQGSQVVQSSIQRFSNRKFSGLESVLHAYRETQGGLNVDAACVAVAGPVRDGSASMTNLDWTINRETLRYAANAETVAILNDLQAQGHSLGHLAPQNVREVIAGPESSKHAAKLVIGLGTGFNMAAVFDTSEGRFVTPSECGHANLPIRTEQELRLCQYVSTAHGFPAVEDVLSGRGLERLYRFLGEEEQDPVEKGAAEIMEACIGENDPRALAAAQMFTRILGTVAGNLALIQLPFGGVYLAGGVARAFAPYLSQFGFADAFRDKGRFAGFMNNFAVHVIEDDYAALTGSAAHLSALLRDL